MKQGLSTEQLRMQQDFRVWAERFTDVTKRPTLLTLRLLAAMPIASVKPLESTMGYLADAMHFQLHELTEAGLVEPVKTAGDGRACGYRLTEAGARLFDPLGKAEATATEVAAP